MLQQAVSEQATDGVLFSRYNDGARPVRVTAGGWEVQGKEGVPLTFTTAQGLLTELTGHPEGRHWSLDRYFGQGAHAPKVSTVGGRVRADKLLGHGNVFDLFPPTPAEPILLAPLAPALIAFKPSFGTPEISVPRDSRKTRKSHSRTSDSLEGLSGLFIFGPVGIDLVHRSHEVRKLMFAGFGRRIHSAGYDAEDVLQEVYKGLLARNRGKCPWDPAKSSFGHYVYMVIGCVLSNYHRKQSRMRQFEQSGMAQYMDGERQYTDAASNTTYPAPETAETARYLLAEASDDLVDHMLRQSRGGGAPEARMAIDVLPYVVVATPRVRIAAELRVSMAVVSRAISYLRKAAQDWHNGLRH